MDDKGKKSRDVKNLSKTCHDNFGKDAQAQISNLTVTSQVKEKKKCDTIQEFSSDTYVLPKTSPVQFTSNVNGAGGLQPQAIGGQEPSKESNLQKENKTLRDENEVLKERLRLAESQHMTWEEQKRMLLGSMDSNMQQRLQRQIDDQNRQKEEVVKLREDNETMHGQIQELKRHLEILLSAKLAADGRCFENISDDCRPMVVGNEYRAFCSEKWLRTKDALDKDLPHISERDKCFILTKILTVASESAIACIDQMLEGLRVSPGECPNYVATVTPTNILIAGQRQWCKERRRITEDIRIALSEYLKIFSREVHTDKWYTSVIQTTFKNVRVKVKDLKCINIIYKYTEEACKLAWRIGVQLPPMRLICDDMAFNPEKHELEMSSPPPGGKTSSVDYYVTPILIHEPDVIVKGRVVLVAQKEKLFVKG